MAKRASIADFLSAGERAWIKREKEQERKAAKAFKLACESGDWERLQLAADWIKDANAGLAWTIAMRHVARLERVSPEIQEAFIGIWTEHKGLPLFVGDNATLAKALRILFPCNYQGPPITLYRGEHHKLRRRIHGFSWTSDIDIARQFAKSNGVLEGGLLLTADVLADAILFARQNEPGYYEESEYIVDPYKLGRVKVLERIAPTSSLPSL